LPPVAALRGGNRRPKVTFFKMRHPALRLHFKMRHFDVRHHDASFPRGFPPFCTGRQPTPFTSAIPLQSGRLNSYLWSHASKPYSERSINLVMFFNCSASALVVQGNFPHPLEVLPTSIITTQWSVKST
jgi:hypothetical protein